MNVQYMISVDMERGLFAKNQREVSTVSSLATCASLDWTRGWEEARFVLLDHVAFNCTCELPQQGHDACHLA